VAVAVVALRQAQPLAVNQQMQAYMCRRLKLCLIAEHKHIGDGLACNWRLAG